jgi:uncharacterized protein YciI
MTFRILATVLALAVANPGLAQSDRDDNEPAAPHYDAELAKQLGADAHGMRSYVLAILKTGPNDASITGEERQEIFRGHFANMDRLAAEGKLVLAGPFGENDQAFRGVFVLAVPTVEEGRVLTQTDPAVKAGVFVVEYLPWYGSAALMQVDDIHARIAEQGI